jgi:DNA-3-methyladenine glycosylase
VIFERFAAGELPAQTVDLARALIGAVLVRDANGRRTAGRIVETEAYTIGDPASHAFAGVRPRNRSMFLEPFHAYVYLIYGTNFCFNVTSESAGEGAAVLVRALEPIEGLEAMALRRGTTTVRDLCRGPGRLARALQIDRSLDGRDLLRDAELWLARGSEADGRVGVSRRIGITKAAHRRLRFYERGNPFVSGPRRLSPP